MTKKKASRRPRSLDEMLVALQRHIRLLGDYTNKVYVEGNLDYAGEIAAKLRVLVTEFGSNEPLLLRLMDETDIQPTLVLGGPPIKRGPGEPSAGDNITLGQYLELDAIGIRVTSGDFIMLNKTQLIRAWAEQTGAAHEDWTMDESLSAILNSGVYIGGDAAASAELKTTVKTVLSVAHRFLQQVGL